MMVVVVVVVNGRLLFGLDTPTPIVRHNVPPRMRTFDTNAVELRGVVNGVIRRESSPRRSGEWCAGQKTHLLGQNDKKSSFSFLL